MHRACAHTDQSCQTQPRRLPVFSKTRLPETSKCGTRTLSTTQRAAQATAPRVDRPRVTCASGAERTVAPGPRGSGEGPLGPSGEMMTQGPEPAGRGLDRPGAQGPGRARKHMRGEPRAAASQGLSGRPA